LVVTGKATTIAGLYNKMPDMQQHEEPSTLQNIVVPDGDWMLLHSDTFIPQRDRILLQSKSFMMDRDLASVKKDTQAYHLSNEFN
jgi:hypothetical protein